jgi:hypothetical protein
MISLDRLSELFTSYVSLTDLNQAEDFSPLGSFAPSGPAIAESIGRGTGEEIPTDPLIQLTKATPLFLIVLLLTSSALSQKSTRGQFRLSS